MCLFVPHCCPGVPGVVVYLAEGYEGLMVKVTKDLW